MPSRGEPVSHTVRTIKPKCQQQTYAVMLWVGYGFGSSWNRSSPTLCVAGSRHIVQTSPRQAADTKCMAVSFTWSLLGVRRGSYIAPTAALLLEIIHREPSRSSVGPKHSGRRPTSGHVPIRR